MTPLERRYGWLLSLYPKRYRATRREELMSTLLDSSRPGQRWPSADEAIPFIGRAIRMRLGLAETQPIGRLLGTVGPSQLVLASLISVMAFFGAEWNPIWGRHVLPGGQVGPFQTTGFVICLSWVATGTTMVFNHPRVTRSLAVVSLTLTAALIPVAHALSLDRPTSAFLAFLFVLGLPAVVSPPQPIRGETAHHIQRTLILISLLVATIVALVLIPTWTGTTLHQYSSGTYGLSPSLLFYELSLRSVSNWLLWIDVAAIVTASALFCMRRRALAGSIALSGLPLVILRLGFRDGFEGGWSGQWGRPFGILLAVSSLLLVSLSTRFPGNDAMERAG
jgi:hypothetical protein